MARIAAKHAKRVAGGTAGSGLNIASVNQTKAMSLALACVASIGFQIYLQPEGFIPTPAMLIVLSVFWFLSSYCFENCSRRLVIVSFCVALLFSAMLVIGRDLENLGDVSWSKTSALTILLISLGMTMIICAAFVYMDRLGKRASVACEWSSKIRAAVFLTILTAQIFVFLILFPGVYAYDGGYLILEVIDDSVALTSQWSVVYTLLLGGLVKASLFLSGDPVLGFAVCMVLQAVVLSLVVTRVIHCAFELSKSYVILVASTLFFVLSPLYLVETVSSAQDIFFGAFFALLLVELVSMAQKNECLCPKGFIVKLMLPALGLMFFRNNGLYVVALTVVVAFCVDIRKRRSLRWGGGCGFIAVRYRVLNCVRARLFADGRCAWK